MAHRYRTSKWLRERILPSVASFLRFLNEGVLPIIVGAALIGAFAWICALIGWLMPASLQAAPISSMVAPPWFHEPGSFAALSLTGLMTLFLGSVVTLLFLVITFFLGIWALRRKLNLDCDESTPQSNVGDSCANNSQVVDQRHQ